MYYDSATRRWSAVRTAPDRPARCSPPPDDGGGTACWNASSPCDLDNAGRAPKSATPVPQSALGKQRFPRIIQPGPLCRGQPTDVGLGDMEQAVACRARQFHSDPAQEQATGMTNVRWQGQSSETHAAASLLVGKGPPQHKHATDREEPERPGFHNERGYPGGEHIWLSGELNCRSQKDQQKNKGLGAEEAPPSASAPDFRAWRAQIESPRPDDRGHHQQRNTQRQPAKNQRLSDSVLDGPHLQGRAPEPFAYHVRNVALQRPLGPALGDSGPEPRHDSHGVSPERSSIRQPPQANLLGREPEPLWQDSNDHRFLAVQRCFFLNNVGITREASVPGLVAQ